MLDIGIDFEDACAVPYNVVPYEILPELESKPRAALKRKQPRSAALSQPHCEDAQMAQRIANGCRASEQQLASKFRPKLFNHLLKLSRHAPTAEDLTHETLLVVLQKLRSDSLNKPEMLASYLFSTARFIYFGGLRKKDNQLELSDTLDEIGCESPELERNYLLEQKTAKVFDVVKELPVERDREILTRRYFMDQTKAEICDSMVLSYTHYNRVISRARQRLKVCVEQYA